MEKPRTAMPVAAGVLIIISEGLKLIIVIGLVVFGALLIVPGSFVFNVWAVVSFLLIPYLVLTVLAFAGGIYAIRRRKWWLALAGSVASVLPVSFLGLAAVILVALSREEFE